MGEKVITDSNRERGKSMENGVDSYRRFLDGDDNGIVEIIRDYKDGLMLFLNRYVRNIHIAEELAEDTFVRIVTVKPRFIATYSFKTWLYTIGRNLTLNYLKRESRMVYAPIEELTWVSEDESLLERAYLREERKIAVHKALSNINPEYSVVLYLKFFEEQSNEQISKIVGKSKRQVENLLYRAKQVLKSELEQEGISYEGF